LRAFILLTLITAPTISPTRALLLAAEDQTSELDLSLKLTPDQIDQDLNQLTEIIHDRWAAANIGNPDYAAAIKDARRKGDQGLTVSDFTVEVQKIISLGADGHAVVIPFGQVMRQNPGYLPMVLNLCQGRYIAYAFDTQGDNVYWPERGYRTRLLRETHPYITKIDGLPVQQWIDAAKPFVSKGPEHAVQWRCLETLGHGAVHFFRNRLDLPQRDRVTVTLVSDHLLAEPLDLELPVAKHSTFPYKIPKPLHRILPGNIGYIWIRNTASGGAETVMEAMPKFRQTDGLIVDLRDNRGGSAVETLQILAAHLLHPQVPTRIIGAIVKNKTTRFKSGDGTVLDYNPALTPAERKTLDEFLPGFKPQWSPPPHQDPQWGYVMLCNPTAIEPNRPPYDNPRFPKTYHYAKPIVVMIDHHTFSGGEILAAGLRTFPNVTLIGEPTSAGAVSPAGVSVTLTQSGIRLSLGQKAFIQINGKPIDGHDAVQPDLRIDNDVDYYLQRRDRMLEKAIEILKNRTNSSRQ
jgi:hypothetical protein